jgi:hypothetical protein
MRFQTRQGGISLFHVHADGVTNGEEAEVEEDRQYGTKKG